MQLTFKFTGTELLAALQKPIGDFTKEVAEAKNKAALYKGIDEKMSVYCSNAPLLAMLIFISERIDKTATYDLSLTECLSMCIVPGARYENSTFKPSDA